MTGRDASHLRRLGAAAAVLLFFFPLASCGNDNDAAKVGDHPVEQRTGENPNGNGTPTENPDAGTGTPTTSANNPGLPGQVNHGTDDGGQNSPLPNAQNPGANP